MNTAVPKNSFVFLNGEPANLIGIGNCIDVAYTPPTTEVETSGTYQGYVLIDDSYDYTKKPATVSGITVTRTGNTSSDKYIGLFGYVYQGTVQNVVLANSTFTGYRYVGGIAGDIDWGTVRNCRVESSVTIRVGCSIGEMFGGIAGYLHGQYALMTGCVSAATIDRNGLECYECGGIVGDVFYSTLKDCLYIGISQSASCAYSRQMGLKGSSPRQQRRSPFATVAVNPNCDSFDEWMSKQWKLMSPTRNVPPLPSIRVISRRF